MADVEHRVFLPCMNWKASDTYGVLMTIKKRSIMFFKVKKIPREDRGQEMLV